MTTKVEFTVAHGNLHEVTEEAIRVRLNEVASKYARLRILILQVNLANPEKPVAEMEALIGDDNECTLTSSGENALVAVEDALRELDYILQEERRDRSAAAESDRPTDNSNLKFGIAAIVVLIAVAAVWISLRNPSNSNVGYVTGTVSYRGVPVEDASVSFINDSVARFGFGRTDKDGGFILSTFDRDDGAIIGSHVVTISKPPENIRVVVDSEDVEAYFAALKAAEEAQQRPSGIPKRYEDPMTSPLRAEVKGGSNSFDFELTDE